MGVLDKLSRKSGVIVGDDVLRLFEYAQEKQFAIPAIVRAPEGCDENRASAEETERILTPGQLRMSLRPRLPWPRWKLPATRNAPSSCNSLRAVLLTSLER